jgi:hypothetical protein
MCNDISIPFDQYQRYGIAARAIDALRKNGEPLNILEVGANTHKILGRMLPNDRIVYLDLEIPLEMQGQEDIMVGDATDLSLLDASFDIVVALDVFEHIPHERREAFLRHTCRVARLLTIIGAPFDFPWVVQAERAALDYWDSLFSEPYRWLTEHAENGLPNLDSTSQAVNSLGYHLHTLHHGDVRLWIDFIKGHFAEVYDDSLHPVLSLLYKYYQDHLFETDFSTSTSYRQFLFCSRESIIVNKIRTFFDLLRKASNTENNNGLPIQILRLLPSVALGKVNLNQAIAERDRQISNLIEEHNLIMNFSSWKIK